MVVVQGMDMVVVAVVVEELLVMGMGNDRLLEMSADVLKS